MKAGIRTSTMEINTIRLPADTETGLSKMANKTAFTSVEKDRRLIKDHAYLVREALFACTTDAQVECGVAFARYLSHSGLNSDNYWLFLRLIMTNNPWVIDELLHGRSPRLLFSIIRPDAELLEAAFETLYSRHPEEMHGPALEAILGIIENAYFDPDDGYMIHRLTIMDINALGKFLIKDEPQEHPVNQLILGILDHMTQIGLYNGDPTKNILSNQAFNVRYAYFDHTRDLIDAIPEPLLIRVKDQSGVDPGEDFAVLFSRRRQMRRYRRGRFIRESVADGAPPAAPDQATT